MSGPGPIETEWRGCRFRSRLEARWAVFFEEAGIAWQYEPEGFETDQCIEEGSLVEDPDEANPPVRYLPDFLLPETKTWVEVKGSREALLADWERLVNILDFSSPLPGMRDSFATNRGLLILGEIPYVEGGIAIHPLIQHRKGLIRSWGTFIPGSGIELLSVQQSLLHGLMEIPEIEYGLESSPDHWTIDSFVIPTLRVYPKVNTAYRAARSARFEFAA